MLNQKHPLQDVDKAVVDRLLAAPVPQDQDIVDLARLFFRYVDFPGARTLKRDLLRVLQAWSLDRKTLNTRARRIWQSGFRPAVPEASEVGSGADVDTPVA